MKVRNSYSLEERLQIARGYRESGKTAKEYAKEIGVNISVVRRACAKEKSCKSPTNNSSSKKLSLRKIGQVSITTEPIPSTFSFSAGTSRLIVAAMCQFTVSVMNALQQELLDVSSISGK